MKIVAGITRFLNSIRQWLNIVTRLLVSVFAGLVILGALGAMVRSFGTYEKLGDLSPYVQTILTVLGVVSAYCLARAAIEPTGTMTQTTSNTQEKRSMKIQWLSLSTR
jgi:TRAP-type C4-dicarboxylate transport system permease small subunit